MALESIRPIPRPIEAPRDKPQVERVEHGNFERAGAVLRPRARSWTALKPAGGWERQVCRPEMRWR